MLAGHSVWQWIAFLRGIAFAMFMAVVGVTVGVQTASAHAQLRETLPLPNAVLETMPEIVTLRFSEPVGILETSWLLPDGMLTGASATVTDATMSVMSPRDGQQGTHVLKWRVASADGHPVQGALVFSIGAVTGTYEAATTATAWVAALCRGLLFIALALSVGGAMFHAFIHELGRSGAFAARMAAAWVFPLGLLLIGAEGADRLGIAPTSMFSLVAFREGLHSPALVSVIIAALCVPLALAAVRTRRASIAVVAIVGAATAIAASGHAWSAGHWSAVPLTALHAGMVMFWVGGLFPLAMAMKDASGAERAGILRRFSRLALPTVILLMAAGSGLVLLREPTLTMIATPWGALLSVKLVIVAMMLLLALWHRQSATPKLAAGTDAPIARSIWLEAGLGICVIFVAMGFRLAPPPSKADSLPPLLHLHGEKVMVNMQADAFAPGQVGFAISLSDHAFGPIDPLDVTLSFSDPATGVGPLDVTARRLSLGAWQAPPLTLPSAGPWTVRVTILVSDFESTWLEGQFPSPVGNGD